MSQAAFDDLEKVIESPDEAFKRELPAVLEGVEDNIAELLTQNPDAFDGLSERMSTLDGIASYASEETETVDRFLVILWDGLALITETVPAVQETVTKSFTVNWESEDSPASFHMESKPDAGTISGGPGLLDDAELTFSGPTDVMFSMLNDDEFNGTLAFIQNKYEIVGPLQRARNLNTMMETVNESMDDISL